MEHAVGHEIVVDEEVLMKFVVSGFSRTCVKARVPALQIARAVVRHAVPQRQILHACGPESGQPARIRMRRAPSAEMSVERGSA